MSENTTAAVEAAQHVVDEVTSYDYSAEPDVIEKALDDGLREAGVRLPDAERTRILEQIHALKSDESAGTPVVREADPA